MGSFQNVYFQICITIFPNKTKWVLKILSNYLKTQAQEFLEILWNYFKTQTYDVPKIQNTEILSYYFRNQTFPEIVLNYFKNKSKVVI